ncbi:KR domain-containing protein [Macrophomina phaseolina]|uniref:KR domain-containing protein n=1 Tax=Macrophomina phaseolina TaxID=35725 RepID=A0ABQ8FP68_9PEZI|nr:KR domain-containing protein [Macrophomina phaseolina]
MFGSPPQSRKYGLTLSVADTGPVKWPEPTSGCYKVTWQLADAFTKKGGSSRPWLIVYNDPSTEEFASEINDHMTFANQAASVCSLSDAKAEQKCGVVICELDSSLLSKADGARYEKLQKLLLVAEEAVWVIRGAQKKPTNPDGSIVLGFTRTLRYELGTKIATLDLDPEADDEEDREAQAGLVAEVAGRIGSSGEGRRDMEFAEEDGMLLVPRLADNEPVTRICHAATGVGGPVEQPLGPERRLKLAFGRPGVVDTVYLEEAEDGGGALADGEIEVRVAATGVTVDDARAAAGLRAGYTVGTECSGTVARVGAGVDGLVVGDRVCCLTRDAFASFARLPASSAAKLPADVPLHVAAALPADFASAYYALVEEGRLHHGDRVLINAVGSLGQAAVQVAAALGADVLLSPDDASTAGADLAINAGPAGSDFVHRAWQSLAPFGRFIQLGDGDGPPLASTVGACGNRSFASVSIDVVAAKRPRLMAEIWHKILELVTSKRVALNADQLSVNPFSRLPAVLRELSSLPVSTSTKHVVVHKAGDRVKSTVAKLPPPQLQPDGCYIVVGGTGGLGRIITEWMITAGARNIFLLSRSTTPSPEVSQLIRRAEASSAHVALQTCDVADKHAVEAVFAACTNTHGPIRGVIHAAMVASKGTPYADTPHADFAAALAPKVAGAWNLHAALAASPRLDFFVLLSSTAGVLGMPGHAGYAAANTYLDGLAAFRARRGLPAAALALGFVLDAGHLAERADLARLRRAGALDGEFVTSADVLALLGAAVAREVGANCTIGIGFGGDGSAARMDPKTQDARLANVRLRGIAREGEDGDGCPLVADGAGSEKGSSLFAELQRADSREGALTFVLEALTKKVAALLLVPVEEVRAAKSTIELGLDSLTMMELLNWVATDLRTRLRMTDLFMVDGLSDLAGQILEKSGIVFQD